LIPEEKAHLHIFAATHPGRKGKNNEDRYSVSSYQRVNEAGQPVLLAIVSDGIGGHQAGEVAAEVAVKTITQGVAASDLVDPLKTLDDAIVRTGDRIREMAEADLSKKGMGATCACALIVGNRLYTTSVGDSRIYLLRGETIRKISIDHTWIQEAIDMGILSPEEARGHPNAHVIRRYLGSQQQVKPDQRLRLNPDETDEQSEANQGLRLVSGDCLLLCSDGLTDLVEDAEILAALRSKKLDVSVDGLVDLANERGGHDNITIIALQVPQKASGKLAPAAPMEKTVPVYLGKRTPLPLTISCIGIGALLLLSGILLGGLYWAVSRPSPTSTPTITFQPFPTVAPTTLPAATDDGPPGIITPLAPTPRIRSTISPSIPTYTPWPTSTLAPDTILSPVP
jgi:PPM family protein phosphatase